MPKTALYSGCQIKTVNNLWIIVRKGALTQAARQGLSARIRFASANMILNFACCFSSPRYRVFRKRSCFLTTPNTCSTFARTDDFTCSAFLAAYCPLLLSFFTCEGRWLILYLILWPDLFLTMASSRLPVPDSRCRRRQPLLLRSAISMLPKRHAHLPA